LFQASLRGVVAQLDAAKVSRSNRVRAVRCGPILPSWRNAEELEAMGLATHEGCRQVPACGGPDAADQRQICGAAPTTPGRGDQRRPRPASPQPLRPGAAARHDARPGRRGSCCSRCWVEDNLLPDVTVLSLSRPPCDGTACDGAVPLDLVPVPYSAVDAAVTA
jgi:hypothetical protein